MRSTQENELLDSHIKRFQDAGGHDSYDAVKLLFLQAIRNPDLDNRKKALQAVCALGTPLKSISPAQWVRKFFLNNGLSQYLNEFNLLDSNKTLVDSMRHGAGNCTNNNSAFKFFISPFLPTVPVLTGGAISGAVDHVTRKPLNKQQLGEFLVSLEKITDRDAMKTVIKNILQKYADEPFYKWHSDASATLLKYLGYIYMDPAERWEQLIHYVTDIERNNGKSLFLNIANVVVLANKFGFEKIKFFQQNTNLPPELTNNIKELFIKLEEKEDLKSSLVLK